MELTDRNYKNIKLSVKQNIALLILNRPKYLNALNYETLAELSDAVDFISHCSEIGGTILTGEGKAFAAGADISQMKDYGAEEARKWADYAQTVFNKIESMEKPVIAAVNGYALGGGCELAMCCDIRIASKMAFFGQPEVNLGVIPCFGGTQRLARLVGVGMAKELIFTARMYPPRRRKQSVW